MNRTDRLLAIVWLLRTRQKMKAEELASVFDVTTRSIYRDIQALVEANVPVISLPGPDGGYSLMKEYSVTPITFTDHEVSALFLGAGFLQATHLGPYGDAVRTAVDKISRVLPETQVRRLRTLQKAVLTDLRWRSPQDREVQVFQVLQRALVDQVTVRARYRAPEGEETERDIDPYGLIYQTGYWYAVGFCRLRQGIRMFRVDRFREIALTDGRFNRPPDFALDPFLFRSWTEDELKDARVEVRLETTREQAEYLFNHPLFGRCNPRRAGSELILDVPERTLGYLVAVILFAAGCIRVLAPEHLCRRVRETAQTLAATHQEQPAPR